MFNLTLRQKIFFSYVVLFTAFLLVMIPFANYMVKKIIIKSMDDQATEMIVNIQKAPSEEALVRFLKAQKPLIFFRVGIITSDLKILYDSHTKRVLGPEFSQEFVVSHPEVLEALEKGDGYHEEYSEILGQKFAYFAKTFEFQGKKYVLRTAFPFQYVEKLLNDFEIGFLLLATVGLLLFSLLTWYAIHRLTKPIEEIIEAIQPYEEGLTPVIPEITHQSSNPNDEFARLAQTLNSLSARIKTQIENLMGERDQKETILESLGEGVVAIDPDLNITYVNHTALELLKKNGQDLKSFDPLLEEALRDGTHKTQSIMVGTGVNAQFLDLIAAPTKDKHGLVLVLQDKTEHHKMIQMRKDFISNASHELKTPITIIMGFAETLYDAPGLPEPQIQQITAKIVHNAQRMNNVIQDLLILSDIENLPLSRLDETDLFELASDCKETLQTVFPDAEVHLHNHMRGHPVLVADRYLLELCLNNLMNNAAKYSNGPAKIDVSFYDMGKEIKVTVADRGLGIPEQDIEHLFQRFYTVDKAHSRKLGGSGLGLSIVKTIIEKHFGEITVESTLGEGSTFTLLLPKERN